MKSRKFITPVKLSILFLAVAGLYSCGPVEYMSQTGVKANKAFVSAKESGAKKKAPYEYYSAHYYLHRSRFKAGYGDYQEAVKYGSKAEQFSKKSEELAVERLEKNLESGADSNNNTSTDKQEKKKVLKVEAEEEEIKIKKEEKDE
ncbi:MAG: DUF4398 domain-containing protein [Deltaproteobacteria bacterium]|nr:DUF4398 domain-containing protein [Deltaproteobacteria bacterium]